MSETIRLPALKRIEGHGRVSLVVDDAGNVTDARFSAIEFRGFEKLVQGRMVWEMPLITSRVCGICPVSHHIVSVKAVDDMLGVEIPPAAKLLRELLQLAGFVHDHALHFFFLAGPDFLMDDAPGSRDLLGVVGARPDLALRAIALRKAGQRVVQAVGGQASHPVTAIPGGMSRGITAEVRDELLPLMEAALTDAIEAEHVAREATLRLLSQHPGYASAPMAMMAQLAPGDVFNVYDGTLVTWAEGARERFDASEYPDRIAERVLPHSYAKAPYLRALGPDAGAYRVGPLPRLNLAASMGGRLADRMHADFHQELGDVVHDALAYHWARMIELVAACERIVAILGEPLVTSTDVRVRVERGGGVGIGVVEAPRGTLIHRYEADDVGRVTSAELIVATTQNASAIDAAVLEAVRGTVVTDDSLGIDVARRMELGIRAYDPCLSCATHEIGRMPLVIEVLGPDGRVRRCEGVA
jgi:F420-non-reducing hydrogenase large subunit